MKTKVTDAIDATRIIVVTRGLALDALEKVSQALMDGGLNVIELAFSASDKAGNLATASCIASLKSKFGDALCVGAGTVLDDEQLRLASDCGAGFIVSPNVDRAIIEKTKEAGLVSIPGALTPTEIAAAHSFGADYIKLFPAAQMGEQYLKTITAPLNHLRLIPFGGITLENYKRFLINGAYGAGIGDSLVNDRYVGTGNYAIITNTAKQYARLTSECIK